MASISEFKCYRNQGLSVTPVKEGCNLKQSRNKSKTYKLNVSVLKEEEGMNKDLERKIVDVSSLVVRTVEMRLEDEKDKKES